MLNAYEESFTDSLNYDYKLKEIRRSAELIRKINETDIDSTNRSNNPVITGILENTGKALISAGNRLLKIA